MSSDVWDAVEAHNRMLVQHETFGHLFPDQIYYEGKIRIASSIYNIGSVVLAESDTLPCSSPWWFDAVNKFADNAVDDMNEGEVAEYDISVSIVAREEELEQWQIDEEAEPKQWQEIHIATLTKKVLVENFK